MQKVNSINEINAIENEAIKDLMLQSLEVSCFKDYCEEEGYEYASTSIEQFGGGEFYFVENTTEDLSYLKENHHIDILSDAESIIMEVAHFDENGNGYFFCATNNNGGPSFFVTKEFLNEYVNLKEAMKNYT